MEQKKQDAGADNILKWILTIQSFSKQITVMWMIMWMETLIFSEVATILQLGDTNAIDTINDNVLQIGLVVCGFYFGTKCVENVARGVETYLMVKDGKLENLKYMKLPESGVKLNEDTTTEEVENNEDDDQLAKG